jgi:hypothetical protein
MKVLSPQNSQTGDVSKTQTVKSKLESLKGFFTISSKEDEKSPFQYICMLIALGGLFTCIFWHEGWNEGTVKTSHIQAMALLVVVATGTYIGGKPTIILFLGVLYFFYASYFSIYSKTPEEVFSKKPDTVEIDGAVVKTISDRKYEVILNKTDDFVDVGQEIWSDGIWPAGQKLVFSGFENGQIERKGRLGKVFPQPPNMISFNNISLPLMLRSKEQGVKVIITLQ